MAPFPRWADLQPDPLCRIGDLLDLKDYASARGACTAWRCSFAPTSPALLLAVAGSDWWRPYAASLPTRRSFGLNAVAFGSRCVGSSNGWLALTVTKPARRPVFILLNPVAAVEIVLPPLIYESNWVSKVVFTPNPTKEDFAVAAICDVDRIAYVTAGARRWAILGPIGLTGDDQLTDLIYTDNGKVYCLTKYGDVHLLRLPERRRRRKPTNADDAGPSEPEFSVIQRPTAQVPRIVFGTDNAGTQVPVPPEFQGLSNVFSESQGLHRQCRHDSSTRISRGPLQFQVPVRVPLPPESQGPDMNAPATVEPFLCEANLPFKPATVFATPYDTVSAFTSAKNLVFCEGSLYQVWRNSSCTVTLQLPGGGQCRVSDNEIFVLRYYPQRQPCWDGVKDLGGYSFFVGKNNAVSMYAEGVPGLRGNCVYWIGGRGRDQGMVFDMATGRSTPCQAPQIGVAPGHVPSTVCWFFLSDLVSNSSSNGGRRDLSISDVKSSGDQE
ncbi:hypothetical protein EJB05_36788, partial [Eragrostis curvula]